MRTKKWPCEFRFAKGDAIYYHHHNKDTYPGTVLEVKHQIIKIVYNGLGDDVTTWVKEQNLSRQQ